MKMLSTDVAKQAETLAKAKDIKAARDAFKPLSALLKHIVAVPRDHDIGAHACDW